MSSHTPGPWEIGSQNGTFEDEGIVGVVAPLQTNSYGRPFRQYVAQYVTPENAKLIKAAPDLLEFAQQVAQVAKNHNNLFIQAWAEHVCRQAGFPVTLKDEVTSRDEQATTAQQIAMGIGGSR